MQTICIYPGRFQPFSNHHFAVYTNLVDLFGVENVYIATSNNPDPLTYSEKCVYTRAYGIPDTNVRMVKNPYRCEEILSEFTPGDTTAIFVVGEKDADRIRLTKQDGTPSWFKLFEPGGKLTIDSGGYLMIVANKSGLSGIANAGFVRNQISAGIDYDDFLELMSFRDIRYAKMAYDILRGKLAIKSKTRKHIMNVWEDLDLTYANLHEIITAACRGTLQNVTEKMDGQNILISYNGSWLFARNKTHLSNPLTFTQLLDHFSHLTHVQLAFREVLTPFMQVCNELTEEERKKYFYGKWLNAEILHPASKNVILYPTKMIALHSINSFTDVGDEISRNFDTCSDLYNRIRDNSVIKIIRNNNIKLNSLPTVDQQYYIRALNSVWKYHNLKINEKLGDLYRKAYPKLDTITNQKERQKFLSEYCYNLVEFLFLKLGAQVLKQCSGYINEGIPVPNTLLADVVKFSTNKQLNRFNNAGGNSSVVNMEGIVFTYNSNIYKFTGSFGPINQILGSSKYKK